MTPPSSAAPLLDCVGLRKTYQMPDHRDRLVLEGINFSLREGEIVAVLGKSGSGKSTFLRLLSGLLLPNAGTVSYRGQPVTGPVHGVGMVFQTFALFPWLTVLGNVELGLEAMGIGPKERRERALQGIDLIGLDGFESAYPKELSGGMRQRVGFARALVTEPDVLILDEPFSALDVLTAETLRSDLLSLWDAQRIPTKGILMVSHNIQESVEMADRILVFSSDPGTIAAEIKVGMPRPRAEDDPQVVDIVDQVYTLLTNQPARSGALRRGPGVAAAPGPGTRTEALSLGFRLPDAAVPQLHGLLENLNEPPYNGKADLPDLADDQSLPVDELFPLIEALQLLGFALVGGGDIELTPSGRAYYEADILERKKLFRSALVQQVPLAAHIRRVLDERPGHRAPADRFRTELGDYLSEDEADRVLDTMIHWGRFAELFSYDYDREVFSLENPGEEEAA